LTQFNAVISRAVLQIENCDALAASRLITLLCGVDEVDFEELKAKLAGIEERASERKKDAIREYCLGNNTVKIGDIVADHIGSVKVERILVEYSLTRPQCVYVGAELKKDLTPRKDGSKRSVYAQNLGRT